MVLMFFEKIATPVIELAIAKVAAGKTYPISRLLTSIPMSAGTGAVGGAAEALGRTAELGLKMDPTLMALMAGLRGASSGMGTWAGRSIKARGTAGRLARGGKGLMGFEKKRLAEAANISPEKLEKLLPGMGQRGASTNPISRGLSSMYSPLAPINLVDRFAVSRAMAGRAARGGKGLVGEERRLIEAIKHHNLKHNINRAAAIGGGAAAVGGGAAVLRHHRKHRQG
jgi:hypothetical protein